MTDFERNIQQLEEQFQRNVDKHTQEFNRDIKRILLIIGVVIVALSIIQGIILWLFTK